jgi:protein-L-isoaspartate(D-aspartate) O-methyltransferase
VDGDDEDALQRADFVAALRQRGIRDERVLAAMAAVPREIFVEAPHVARAYADQALPIACGQTISQPYVVAAMTEALAVGDRDKVLEIGTGSGYQTAVLARLARRVYTIDRYRTLVAAAAARFGALGIPNITMMTADGMLGWPAQAPFDRIIVTAAGPELPPALVEQLKEGGILVAPIGPHGGEQRLCRFEKRDGELSRTDLFGVRFVPLVAGKATAM